jgi:hypothetical protein
MDKIIEKINYSCPWCCRDHEIEEMDKLRKVIRGELKYKDLVIDK